MNENVSLLQALLGGLVSFISPCVLPLIPAYISYISGLSIEQLRKEEELSARTRLLVLVNAAAFVLGFSAVFILLGATATLVGSFLKDAMPVVAKVAGVIVVIFGLHVAGVIRIPFLYYEKRFSVRTKVVSFFSAVLMGAAFAFGWTPCIGPILMAILALASTQETVAKGILLLSAFSLGLGVPFILTAAAVGFFFKVFARLRKVFRIVEIASGVLLIFIGVLIFFGSLSKITQFLFQVFPFLGNLG